MRNWCVEGPVPYEIPIQSVNRNPLIGCDSSSLKNETFTLYIQKRKWFLKLCMLDEIWCLMKFQISQVCSLGHIYVFHKKTLLVQLWLYEVSDLTIVKIIIDPFYQEWKLYNVIPKKTECFQSAVFECFVWKFNWKYKFPGQQDHRSRGKKS